ncbi:unnamed protein product [Cuscuta europaea]|uniref:Uncharacterized protein n=1 Tax=Cuscuta europaea TaxID=41803 RepID=A0A9P0Z1T2_CUSEU|nr:unnamed protein product [Cuscuta europaea]
MLEKVVGMFVKYLESKKMLQKANTVRKLKGKRLPMSWRDPKDVYDYEVLAMRHMETYHGEGLLGWSIGLNRQDNKELGALRRKYVAAILLHESNDLMQEIMMNAKQFAKITKAERLNAA